MKDNSSLLVLGAVLLVAIIGWGLGLGPDSATVGTENAEQQVAENTKPVVAEASSLILVTPLRQLQMIEPMFSEKAVYADESVMILFRVPLNEQGLAKSELSFHLENRSSEVIQIIWDECSVQLPGADTVNIMHEEMRFDSRSSSSPPTSVAPGGDILETVIPVSEVCRNEPDGEWYVTESVFDGGDFHFVLALKKTGGSCGEPEMEYYHFRFIIR